MILLALSLFFFGVLAGMAWADWTRLTRSRPPTPTRAQRVADLEERLERRLPVPEPVAAYAPTIEQVVENAYMAGLRKGLAAPIPEWALEAHLEDGRDAILECAVSTAVLVAAAYGDGAHRFRSAITAFPRPDDPVAQEAAMLVVMGTGVEQ